MSHLYPNLDATLKSEELCPICNTGIEHVVKFSCPNNHVLCDQCKPYYYTCPKCYLPIETRIPPSEVNLNRQPPQQSHHMPDPNSQYQSHAPYPGNVPMPMPMPSAPASEFLNHEKNNWNPPPSRDQELIACSYTQYGCWIKFPEHLRIMHESRCQFRHLNDNQSDDGYKYDDEDDDELTNCIYKEAGCNIRVPKWKKKTHEDNCPYKGRYEALEGLRYQLEKTTFDQEEDEDSYRDPEEMVECKFRKYGCMVQMPFRKKRIHEEKCNYYASSSSSDEEVDPEQQVDCKWAKYGCKVKPKFYRKGIHEEKCNYKK